MNPSWASKVIDRIRAVNNDTNVETHNQHTINTIKRDIAKTFDESPDWELVTVNDEEEKRELLIINGDTFYKKKAMTKPYDKNLNYGDMLDVYEDEFDDRRKYVKWLVTDVNAKKTINSTAEITRCNTLVTWQNVETLEIISRWAIDDRPYSSNLDKDKIITSPKKEFILKFKSDEETRKIGVNRRFLLYKMYDIKTMKEVPIASLVQAFNPINTPNIVEINVVEDASFNVATDNAELMIADYIDPTITVELIPIPELLRGDSIQIKSVFYQRGNVIDVVPKFESSNEEIAVVNENGLITGNQIGSVEISVIYQGAIGKLNIHIVDMQISDKHIEITGIDFIKNNRSAEYTGFIFDNGVKQNDKVIWSLDTSDLLNPFPYLTIIDDNNVRLTITNNDNNIDKSLKLICRDELNTLEIIKNIEIISLFG